MGYAAIMLLLANQVLAQVISQKGPVLPNQYLQLSDSTTQQPSVTTPVQVTMDTIDAQNGFDYTVPGGSITIPSTGVYLIIFGGQVIETVGAGATVDMWLRKNGVDIPNTGVRHSMSTANDNKVVVLNYTGRFAINDIIAVMMAVSATGKGLGIGVFSPSGQARIPSIITSIAKIMN